MLDLTTSYLGLSLRNPLVASASPLTEHVDTVRQLADAGIAAVVMPSLFEEQITHESLELDHYLHATSHTYAESLDFFPDFERYEIGPDAYLDQVRRLKRAVQIPIIGSLNGVSSGGWIEYARKIEEAGADALELNIYFLPGAAEVSGEDVEHMYVSLVRDVCTQVSIPVGVKLTPFFTSLPNMARRLVRAGARGLVLFNRFYQPDFDVDALEVVPRLELSHSRDLRLPLQWIAMLYGRVQADLALTTGVHAAEDVVKAVMSGAAVAMMASELLAHGPQRVASLLDELTQWLEEHEYPSIAHMCGSMSQRALADPGAYERASYMKVLRSYRQLP
jgi:dihydroorotate dehydrogenase (fumarate)